MSTETQTEFFGGSPSEVAEAAEKSAQQSPENIAPSEDVFLGFAKPEGGTPPKPEEDKDGKEKTEDGKEKTDGEADKEAKGEASKQKPEAEKPEDKSKPEEKKKPKADKKDEKKDTPFEVNFDGGQKPNEPEQPKPQERKETYEVQEQDVLKFLKEREGFQSLEDLSSLSIKEELAEPVKAFQKFHAETGGGIEAYYQSSKDWTKEDKDLVIKKHLELTNPNATEANIEKKLALLKLTEAEREALTPREVDRADLAYDDAYNNALSYMQDVARRYAVPKEKPASAVQKETPEQVAEKYGPYWKKRDESLSGLQEFKLSVDGVGELNVPITAEMKELVGKNTQTYEDFFTRWQTDKGIDTDELTMDTLWGIKSVRRELIAEMLQQMHVKTIESISKTNRKVNLKKPSEAPEIKDTEGKAGMVVVDGGGQPQSEKNMGKPLF